MQNGILMLLGTVLVVILLARRPVTTIVTPKSAWEVLGHVDTSVIGMFLGVVRKKLGSLPRREQTFRHGTVNPLK